MTSGEEIDYTKFIGKWIPAQKTEEQQMEEKLNIENMKKIREEEDKIAAIRYKSRKESLKHKYSPARRSISKEEKEIFFKKSQL